jgi:RHS repeat-associated protein
VYINNENTTSTDYVGNIAYTDGAFDYLITGEGRVTKASDTSHFVYEYHLKDHLGNTRVAFEATSANTLKVVQKADYYPFGLQFQSGASGSGNNKYLYNGKELQDDMVGCTSLGWYDYGFRFYDPQIGRFTTQDALAEKYFDWSPYNYVGNNPIKRVDLLGLDWYTDKDGTYQYDPKVNEKSKLQDGQKYVGRNYFARDSKGNIKTMYRMDGSILYTDRKEALQRVFDNTQKTGNEELAIMTEGGGALVTPDYKNTTSSCSPFEFYNYSFDGEGNVSDAQGNSFAAEGSIHTHPYDKGSPKENQPDPFPSGTNWGVGDLETFARVTPNKPAMTMGWDGKAYGVFGSYKNNSGNNSDLKWGWLGKNGVFTVQEILKSSGKLQLLMNSTFKIK